MTLPLGRNYQRRGVGGANRASGVGESRASSSGVIGLSAGIQSFPALRILGAAGQAIGVEPNAAR